MNIRNARDVGLLLRDRRKTVGIGQQALADHLGVSRYWVSQLENGNAGAAIGQTLNALAMLGISLDARPLDEGKGQNPADLSIIEQLLARGSE
jgi:transcriptional regulator with XRE-family HTH domain